VAGQQAPYVGARMRLKVGRAGVKGEMGQNSSGRPAEVRLVLFFYFYLLFPFFYFQVPFEFKFKFKPVPIYSRIIL
jgi:hypothetical protein